jgi:hypothetical protein
MKKLIINNLHIWRKLIINNLHKIHHSTIILNAIEWEITVTGETESGDGYDFLLVTDELDTSTIWVSNTLNISTGNVKMIRRWNGTEWWAWANTNRMNSPDEFVRELGNVHWQIQ